MAEIKIVNASTGEEIVREMTEQELADLKLAHDEAKAQAKAKEAAQAKLEALGLTADDLKALLS